MKKATRAEGRAGAEGHRRGDAGRRASTVDAAAGRRRPRAAGELPTADELQAAWPTWSRA